MDKEMMKMRREVPVILFVYNRAEHTRRVLEYLNRNMGIEETTLYIFSDGPKEGEEDKVAKVRSVVDSFCESNNFKTVEVSKSEKNKGLANSVISGVSSVMDKYGRVVVLEDDLLASKDFYMYMVDALDYYEEESRVWSIAGYSPRMKRLEKTEHEVYVCPRVGSWGWATWKNRWETVDWNVSDYDSFKSDKQLRSMFEKRSPGLANMLDYQMQGIIDSWAIRWGYQQFKSQTYTINPVRSKIKNIGNDATGTHGETDDKWDTELEETVRATRFEPFSIDKRAFKEYNWYFTNPMWRRIYRRLRILYGKLCAMGGEKNEK